MTWPASCRMIRMHSDQVPPSTSKISFFSSPHQARMREIKRNGDAGGVFRAEPFARNPGMRPHADVVLVELGIKRVQASLQPRALDRHFEVLDADVQQLVVGQRCPEIFLTRHGRRNRNRSRRRWCHGPPLATTVNGLGIKGPVASRRSKNTAGCAAPGQPVSRDWK